MTVVAIVGAMSALATFALQQSIVQSRVSGEIRRAMSRVQQARSLSVATGQCHGVLVGGPQSTLIAGTTPLRNRIVVFRKPAGAGCNDFDPGTDVLVSNDFIGAEGSVADVNRSDLVWDALEATPDTELKMLFGTDDGRPLVLLGTTVQAPVPGPPQRYFFQLRSNRYDVSAGNPVGNPTRRRLEVTPTGTAMVALCASGPNINPCQP